MSEFLSPTPSSTPSSTQDFASIPVTCAPAAGSGFHANWHMLLMGKQKTNTPISVPPNAANEPHGLTPSGVQSGGFGKLLSKIHSLYSEYVFLSQPLNDVPYQGHAGTENRKIKR